MNDGKLHMERWGIGLEIAPRQVSMIAENFYTEEDALAFPGHMRHRIIHIQEDDQWVMRWWWHNGKWVRRMKVILDR